MLLTLHAGHTMVALPPLWKTDQEMGQGTGVARGAQEFGEALYSKHAVSA